MLQLQQTERLWKTGELKIVAISFESPEVLPRLAEAFPDAFAFISDPERAIYALYGAGTAPWWRVYSPRTVFHYAKALFAGKLRSGPRRKPGEVADVGQMGGDFLVDGRGRLRLVHHSREPADRPAAEEILALWESAGNAGPGN